MGLNLLLSLLIQFAYQVTANCSMSVRKILLTSVKKKELVCRYFGHIALLKKHGCFLSLNTESKAKSTIPGAKDQKAFF